MIDVGRIWIAESKWTPVRCEEEWILALGGILEYVLADQRMNRWFRFVRR